MCLSVSMCVNICVYVCVYISMCVYIYIYISLPPLPCELGLTGFGETFDTAVCGFEALT